MDIYEVIVQEVVHTSGFVKEIQDVFTSGRRDCSLYSSFDYCDTSIGDGGWSRLLLAV